MSRDGQEGVKEILLTTKPCDNLPNIHQRLRLVWERYFQSATLFGQSLLSAEITIIGKNVQL